MNDDLTISWRPGDDPADLRDREWLVTNGLGGYASGTLLGPISRRHHGLFVPNLSEPNGRHVLLSSLDEEVVVQGAAQRLAGVERPDETLETASHRHLTSFQLRRGVPTWTFHIEGRTIERTIITPHAKNTVCVLYKLVSGEPLSMRFRLWVAFRRVDDTVGAGPRTFVVTPEDGRDRIALEGSALRMETTVAPRTAFVPELRDGGTAFLRIERDRGYDHEEPMLSPGYYDVQLSDEVTFVATTEPWETLRVTDLDGAAARGAEATRKEALLDLVDPALREGFAAQLVCAADQFIAIPGGRKEEMAASHGQLRTVMAGYHWFADWGRDTMISLEGLTVTTRRFHEAGAILRTFSRYVKDGLLPNLFPEGARQALYHTVDATLWYFHAIERYRKASGDDAIVAELYPVLTDIVDHYVNGTLYGIGVDKDGLVKAGEVGYQLTWMDAKVDDWVVTPRRGKPVEIQALWFNALSLMASWTQAIVKGDPAPFLSRAAQAQASFELRYPTTRGLYDVVDGEDGKDDPKCRPNQIFSISLDHPILDKARWSDVLGVVERELLTPMGLRTLSRDNPDYKGRYEGNLRARDAAYHEGTVWPWLLGHYVDACLKVRGDRTAARALLAAFPEHLLHAGVGSISEITDAEAPYTPRGCIAQAWSVAEVLRAYARTA